MSLLPVPASVSQAEQASLVLRRPRHSGPPVATRGNGPGVGSSDRSLFVIDGPSLTTTPGPPVVVIAVNVVAQVGEGRGVSSRGEASTLSRLFRLPVVGDPYAQFGEPNRGSLVDEYV